MTWIKAEVISIKLDNTIIIRYHFLQMNCTCLMVRNAYKMHIHSYMHRFVFCSVQFFQTRLQPLPGPPIPRTQGTSGERHQHSTLGALCACESHAFEFCVRVSMCAGMCASRTYSVTTGHMSPRHNKLAVSTQHDHIIVYSCDIVSKCHSMCWACWCTAGESQVHCVGGVHCVWEPYGGRV